MSMNWCRVKDSHPQPSRSERDASAGWANAAKWHSRQESHLQPPRSKRGALIIALREQKNSKKERGRQKRTQAHFTDTSFNYFSICRSFSKMEPTERLALSWGEF